MPGRHETGERSGGSEPRAHPRVSREEAQTIFAVHKRFGRRGVQSGQVFDYPPTVSPSWFEYALQIDKGELPDVRFGVCLSRIIEYVRHVKVTMCEPEIMEYGDKMRDRVDPEPTAWLMFPAGAGRPVIGKTTLEGITGDRIKQNEASNLERAAHDVAEADRLCGRDTGGRQSLRIAVFDLGRALREMARTPPRPLSPQRGTLEPFEITDIRATFRMFEVNAPPLPPCLQAGLVQPLAGPEPEHGIEIRQAGGEKPRCVFRINLEAMPHGPLLTPCRRAVP